MRWRYAGLFLILFLAVSCTHKQNQAAPWTTDANAVLLGSNGGASPSQSGSDHDYYSNRPPMMMYGPQNSSGKILAAITGVECGPDDTYIIDVSWLTTVEGIVNIRIEYENAPMSATAGFLEMRNPLLLEETDLKTGSETYEIPSTGIYDAGDAILIRAVIEGTTDSKDVISPVYKFTVLEMC